ncbi:ABC transporter permease [Loigolactobacillus zhaoyuanensis]|uniref:ABC transporter permease n=1 Tax=Loigolactobacillus zhaoyuanensis TaxID=2486017 RepID=A0ABW8UAN7_9LACO|nr:ABC transporter permease [Loigolactobacillus zhaoyuanensis]
MLKRKSLLVVLLVLVAFLGVFFFSQMNRVVYQDLLNHAGLTTNAQVIKTKSKETIVTANQELAKKSQLTDYQVQYRQPHSHTIFMYGAGNFKTLPLISGRFFSDSDFSSPVPVAVVGQTVAKKLYSPTNQSYLKYGDRYLSVIGVVGNKKNSQLDKMIFISTSPQQSLAAQSLSHFEIRLDGKPKLAHLSTFKSLFQATSMKHLLPQSTPFVGLAWLQEYWWFGGALILIIALFIGVVELWLILARRMLKTAGFYTDDTKDFYWRELRHFALWALLGITVGGLIGAWQLYILQYDLLALILGSNYLVCLLYYGLRLRHTLKLTH